jgi:hypothetical protein
MQKCRIFYQHYIVIQRPHCRVLDSAEMFKIAFIMSFPVNDLHLKTDCKSKELLALQGYTELISLEDQKANPISKGLINVVGALFAFGKS